MTREDAIRKLAEWDRKGRCVFAAQDLARLFPADSPGAFNKGLDRLVKGGILRHSFRAGDRPMRLTDAQTAWRDLKRVGRNTHLVDTEVLEERRALFQPMCSGLHPGPGQFSGAPGSRNGSTTQPGTGAAFREKKASRTALYDLSGLSSNRFASDSSYWWPFATPTEASWEFRS